MGFESFQIVLRGGPTNHLEASQFIRKLPNVKADQGFLRESTYFVMDDGQHTIDVEVDNCDPLRISCRFILSHPSSIDDVFLRFIRELMAQLGMEAKICDDAQPDHFFSIDKFIDFSTTASHYIAARRKEWIAMMGPELAANRVDLYQRIILPRCEPIAEPVAQS